MGNGLLVASSQFFHGFGGYCHQETFDCLVVTFQKFRIFKSATFFSGNDLTMFNFLASVKSFFLHITGYKDVWWVFIKFYTSIKQRYFAEQLRLNWFVVGTCSQKQGQDQASRLQNDCAFRVFIIKNITGVLINTWDSTRFISSLLISVVQHFKENQFTNRWQNDGTNYAHLIKTLVWLGCLS